MGSNNSIDHSSDLRSRFDQEFFSYLNRTSFKSAPVALREATHYALSGTGKRLRPSLALEAARLNHITHESAMFLAAATETLHTYSLVHDDLPAMDDDDYRRGQLTCHKKFGEDVGILVGDLLQSIAFELLALAEVDALVVRYFARCTGAAGMVSGQFLDTQSTSRANLHPLKIHRLKTARLIEACICMPYLMKKNISMDYFRWARKLGLFFQITDDLIDAQSSSEVLGKTAGKDLAQDKLTAVSFWGLPQARSMAQKIAEELYAKALQLFPDSPFFISLPQMLLHRIR